MAVMRLIMIIRVAIMINPKKVEEYFSKSKNRISSADEIAKLTFARPPLSTTPYFSPVGGLVLVLSSRWPQATVV